MDFFALHRRDLQALCKRNGVRANMTNVAMAEALAALPAVDGIEEYVKEPVAVPAPVVEAVAADEQRREKQGSPLPRGRRVTVKAVEANVGKGDVEEDEKREPAKEDPPALGAGRRGPNRRGRAAHGIATSVAVPVGKAEEAEDKQDGSNEENQRREANEEDVPAPVLARRAASRRARPAAATESARAGAGEEQMEIEGTQIPRRRVLVNSSDPIRPDDYEVEDKEDHKQEASTDDAPAIGVCHRGPSRRARPTPALAAPTGKVAEQEKTAPIPRGRHAKTKSTDEVKPDDGEAVEKQGRKPEEEEEAGVSALGVGHRGASRRAHVAPSMAAPAGKVTAEVVITLEDSEEEEKEDTKPEGKDNDGPAIGVGRRRANTRAPAPEEASATRRCASTRKTEAEDAALDTVHIRPTRQRKPTMKAAAAAMEKVLPKATRRGEVKNTVSQQDEQEKTQGTISDVVAVPEPVPHEGCDNPEDSIEAADPHNTVQKQEDEGMVIIDHEILMKENTTQKQEDEDEDEENPVMKEIPTQELLVMDQEGMDYSALQERQQDIDKSPALLTSQEDSPILGIVTMADEQATEKDEGDNFKEGYGSSEASVDKRVFEAEELEFVPIIQAAVTGDANHESEMGNFSEVPVVPHDTEVASEDNTDADLVRQENIDQLQAELADGSVHVDCSGMVNLFAKEDTSDVNTEDGFSYQENGDVDSYMTLPDPLAEAIPSGFSSAISWVQMEKAGDITSEMPESSVALDEDAVGELVDAVHDDELKELVVIDEGVQLTETEGKLFKEDKANVITEEPINTGMDECVQKNDLEIGFSLDELNNAVTADNVPEVTGADGNTKKAFTSDLQQGLVTEYLSKSSITVEPTLSVSEGTSVYSDSSENKAVEPVTRDITSEMPESPGSLDEDGGLDEVVITEEEPQSTDTMDENVEEHQFKNAADQVVIAVSVPDLKISDFEVTEQTKTTLIIDEKQSSTVTMDDVGDNFETYAVHADELKEVLPTDKVAHLTGTEGDVVEEDRAGVITGEVPNSTGVMVDEYVQTADFEICFALDELNSAVTTDGNTENTFTCDLPQELNVTEESDDHITPALLAEDTEYLSKSTITVEPTVSISEATSVCNNSSEKKAAESVVILKEKDSVDLLKLSRRQLRAKLKEALIAKKNKEAKRVALARVDENVCRSHAKGQ